ncbi:hypothetical protein CXB51_003230 [Gossypium anomalum]|uniref:Reverse transcriptase Ty1/copia-type domain-containing protein n=1 Tax=Gossypium anomalum TaxID=47600 RepID=A0A8J6A045_9ROSI|nr:hypothetical protein CXB51_003230 [Gossypium anomalum]
MDSSSSSSTVQSITPLMVSNLNDGVIDSHFYSTKKISVLLDDNNYLFWCQQLLDDTGLLQENLVFARFEQQDSALASWLLSSRMCEHVTTILNGLLPDYESAITIITASQCLKTTVLLHHHIDPYQIVKAVGAVVPLALVFNVSCVENQVGSSLLHQFPTGTILLLLTLRSMSIHLPQQLRPLRLTLQLLTQSIIMLGTLTRVQHTSLNSTASLSEHAPTMLFIRPQLLVPGITKNLLYVYKFAKDNQVMFEFFPQQCQVSDLQTREVFLRGLVHDSLYRLSLPGLPKSALSPDPVQCFTTTTAIVPLSIWHSRLGHPCKATLTTILHHCNIPFDTNKDPLNCIAYHLRKEHKLPFLKSLSEYVKPLQLVVANVWGPALIPSNSFRYYVTFTDTYTRYTWLYFLKKKSEVLNVFPLFHRQVERTLGCKLLALQLDEVGNFNNTAYLINRLPSSSLGYSPQHKGYRCQDSSGRIYISRQVIFNESVFPFKNTSPQLIPYTSPSQSSSKLLVLLPDSLSTTSTSQPLSLSPLDPPPPLPSVSYNSHAMVTCSKAGIFKPKVKRKADWIVERYKARLVAKRFSQHARFDFRDTYSSVVRATTIRIVLAIAVMHGWSLRLNNELYCLCQAPHAWFHTLKQYLVTQLGFYASKANSSLFIYESSGNVLLLMAYVDDIIITGNSSKAIDNVVTRLHNKFALKDMGRLSFFLGVKVQHTSQGLLLSQRKYISEILHKTGMVGAAATPTPMVSTPKLVASDGSPPFADVHLYQSIVDRRSTTGYVVYLGPNLLHGVLRTEKRNWNIDFLATSGLINYVPSSKQIVDVLTKPITPKQFTSFRQALQVLSIDAVLRSLNTEETRSMLE